MKKKEVCLLATVGAIGAGFKEETFYKALESNPDVIAADSGSCDDGPYYLGEGVPRTNRKAAKWELRLMIKEGVKRGIPVLVGSAATSGADPNVDWMVDIVKEIAREEDLHFKLAEVKTEIDKDTLRKYMKAGKMKALEAAPPFTLEDVDSLHRCVGVMGAEPYIQALNHGAQVVICGRSTDTAIFAAVSIMNGFNNGAAWHAGKVLECGAAAAAYRPYSDCMLAWVREDSFSIEPANPIMYCTPLSIAAHTLYENSNPFVMTEPSGQLFTENSIFEAETDRRVRVSNSRFVHNDQCTIKLEGVKLLGYRRVAVGGIADPLVLKQLNSFLDRCLEATRIKVANTMNIPKEEYLMRYLVYGNPDVEEPGEVGVMFEVIAKNPEDADGIMGSLWHIALHVPIREWEGMQSQIAYPVSPTTLDGGRAYQYCLNHVLEVEDPVELFRFQYYDL